MSQLNRYASFEIIWWEIPVIKKYFHEYAQKVRFEQLVHNHFNIQHQNLQISQTFKIPETQRNWSTQVITINITRKGGKTVKSSVKFDIEI